MSKSISKKEVSMSIGGVGGDKPIFGSVFGKAPAKTGKMQNGKKVTAGGVPSQNKTDNSIKRLVSGLLNVIGAIFSGLSKFTEFVSKYSFKASDQLDPNIKKTADDVQAAHKF